MDSNNAPNVPPTPNPSSLYNQFTNMYLQHQPRYLGAEQQARGQYDPQRIAEQQQLQNQFGPTQYAQMRQAFQQLDPTYFKAREQLGGELTSQAALGSQLSPDQEREIQQQVRGSQAARGNASGSAAGIAEAYTQGSRGLQLQQQRYSNLNSFLQDPTMAQMSGFVPPVAADRSSAYINPNAGFQGVNFGLQNYQNQLGGAALQQQSGGNPWMSALGSIGTAAGAYAGALAMSDRRLKTDIKKVGEGPKGVGIYEFAYKSPQKHVGYMAQEVEQKFPEHVFDTASGYKAVSAAFAPVEVS